MATDSAGSSRIIYQCDQLIVLSGITEEESASLSMTAFTCYVRNLTSALNPSLWAEQWAEEWATTGGAQGASAMSRSRTHLVWRMARSLGWDLILPSSASQCDAYPTERIGNCYIR